MKAKIYTLFVFSLLCFQSCKAQETQTSLPKVENHLNGKLDYTHEDLVLVDRQDNGEEINIGKIDKDGIIHFSLPEFNIKALYDSIPLQPYKLQGWLSMENCKDKDAFAKTPFDGLYSKKYVLYVKKYGIKVAVLEAVSDEKKTKNNGRGIGSKFSWFYIDRAIDYKDECIKTSYNNDTIEATINVNIPFEKGWNFIEENQVAVQDYEDGKITKPEKIQFTKTSPANKKVKWFLRQIQDDKKIQIAKKLDKLTPITKKQFEKWTPKKLGDLSVTTKEYGKPPKGSKNKNNIHLIYTNKGQKTKIDLYVVDCAKSPDDMEMINFAYAMENDGKDEKDIKPYVAQYSEREKAMSFLYKVEDRIFVSASGVNITAEELWAYIQKLNIEKLLEKEAAKTIYNSDSTTVKFEGIITNAKNDCWADGICSVEVNHKWWITITSGLGDPSLPKKERGLATGIRFTKDNESIGKKVKVFAEIQNDNHLTLEGSKAYYIKTIE